MPSFENMESFGYTILKEPLETLNIVYPHPEFLFKPPKKIIGGEPNKFGQTSENKKEEGEGEGEGEGEEVAVGIEGEEVAEENESANAESSNNTISTSESNSTESSLENDIPLNEDLIKNMIGKQGLSNVMTYKTIRSQYELRYDFEYKPQFLQTFEPMFHPNNIHLYSSKIAKICECVRNSTGVVIIYSQYIDGGVVPIALALEEMGFSRFGSANYTRSLFKTPPTTEPIDATTMLSRTEFAKKQTDGKTFNPAKYVMITGDKSFSPDNLEDVKYVTNPNNKYGEKVKVILITKAAAEGLDFKFIRQIHILEPWYNLNRIEQIVGRGVRNLSHCGLPFKERNVEIYLHASQPLNNEEPADLYVYRFAKNKAIKIGEVTRLLKETAIDCILNVEQSNFTIDKLSSLVQDQNITIRISSKLNGEPQEIPFQIGDRPHTDICDYKDDCRFTCSPIAEITDADLNKSSYNENFTKMNYSAIIKRIRQLFKEQSFYTRQTLFNSIYILRKYPEEHIDYALSQFIDNKNNLLVDQYGNSGYLINIDDVYAFQPIEITDERTSILERSKPVAFNHEKLEMELPTEKIKDEDFEQLKPPEYSQIIDEISQNWDLLEIEIENAKNKEKFPATEINWFKHLGRVYENLVTNHNIPPAFIKQSAIYHYLDTSSFESRLTLLNSLYKQSDPNEIERIILTYFGEKLVTSRRGKGVYIPNNNRSTLYILNDETKEWVEATPSQKPDFVSDIKKKYIIQSDRTINNFVGFMHMFKDEMVFKTKNMTESRNNTGAKCSSAGKLDVIKRINKIIADAIDRNIIENGPMYEGNSEFVRTGLCVILEILLRYFNTLGLHIWFLDVEKSLANEIISKKYDATSQRLIIHP
jgi:hypothetical protein